MAHESPTDIIRRLTARHTVDGYTSHSELCRSYEEQISRLCADLAVYRGTALTPQPGCVLHEVMWGDAYVWIELEVEPETGDGWNEPYCPESVRVIGILINGVMCSADLADEDTQARWIADWMAEREADRTDQQVEAARSWRAAA